MLKQFSKLLAVCAFALVTTAFSGQAHAEAFKVRVDNFFNPSEYDAARSTEEITITVHFVNWGSISQYRVMNTISGQHDFNFNSPTNVSVSRIDRITISAPWHGPGTANDLFIVDQVELFGSNNALLTRWGLDNEDGWCVSHEARDALNGHCGSVPAAGSQYFDRTAYVTF